MQILTYMFSNMRMLDIIDIFIVAFVFYQLMLLISGTRAEQLIKGLVILLVLLKVSEWSKLYVLHFILKNTLTLGVVALLIVFQPELRRALEYIGRHKIVGSGMSNEDATDIIHSIKQVVEAASILSREKTGALIVFERETGLGDIIPTGVKIDGVLSNGLLLNIFVPNTPLHDGAVIIRKGRIVAAGCFLPLSDSRNLSKEIGTRHRAALGICEESDAVVVIISEETGAISIAVGGKLSRFLDAHTLESRLISEMHVNDEPSILKKKWRKSHEGE